MSYTPHIRILRVPSSSRISPKLMLYTFSAGADAILIGDCPAKGSRFPWNIDFTNDNISRVQNILQDEHIEGDRIRFSEFDTTMLTNFISTVNGLAEQIQQLPAISEEQRTRLKVLGAGF